MDFRAFDYSIYMKANLLDWFLKYTVPSMENKWSSLKLIVCREKDINSHKITCTIL